MPLIQSAEFKTATVDRDKILKVVAVYLQSDYLQGFGVKKNNFPFSSLLTMEKEFENLSDQK